MKISVVKGDITKQNVDIIVNAAKTSLLGGSGVDGAIHRASGFKLLEECRSLGGCRPGDAKITGAYDIPVKNIIHTPGPVWYGGNEGEPELLASCYRKSLELAVAHGAKSIAFPCISTGVYGYPKEEAAKIAWQTVNEFLKTQDIDVVFVCFEQEDYNIYKRMTNE